MTPDLPPSDPRAAAASLRIDRSRPAPRRGGGGGVWVVALLLVGVVGWVSWNWLGKAAGVLGGREVREGRVARVSPNSGAEQTTASGYVVARTRAALSPREAGKLVRLLVDVGDRVEKGQLLAEMDHDQLDAALARLQAEVARAEADLDVAGRSAVERRAATERARLDAEAARSALRAVTLRSEDARREADRLEKLLADRVVTRSERDTAEMLARALDAQVAQGKAAVEAAEAEETRSARDAETQVSRVEAARAGVASAKAGRDEVAARRDDYFLHAEFAGVVLRKEAEVGEVVAPAIAGGSTTRGAVLTLADFSTLEMEVDVFERDVSRVESGAPCRILLDAYPRDPFPGRVRQVVPTADRQKATVQVKVAFDAPDSRVLPEMGGKVVFLEMGTEVSNAADRILVPTAALVDRGGRRGVFLLEREGTEERVRFTPVEAGAAEGDRTVARGGLSGGERVVLDPAADLADGSRVTLSKAAKDR